MINRRVISEDEARKAIELGEFPESIRTSQSRVAIILTQNWCPQWRSMKRWLKKVEKNGVDDGTDIDIYELEYNGKPFGKEFMRFKESVLGNDLVPYVRYYRNGEFIGDSNFVSRDRFFALLNGDSST